MLTYRCRLLALTTVLFTACSASGTEHANRTKEMARPACEVSSEEFLTFQQSAVEKMRSDTYQAMETFFSDHGETVTDFAANISDPPIGNLWAPSVFATTQIGDYLVETKSDFALQRRLVRELVVHDANSELMFSITVGDLSDSYDVAVKVGEKNTWTFQLADYSPPNYMYEFDLAFLQGSYVYEPLHQAYYHAFVLNAANSKIAAKRTGDDTNSDFPENVVLVDDGQICNLDEHFWPALLPFPGPELKITDLVRALGRDFPQINQPEQVGLVFPPLNER